LSDRHGVIAPKAVTQMVDGSTIPEGKIEKDEKFFVQGGATFGKKGNSGLARREKEEECICVIR